MSILTILSAWIADGTLSVIHREVERTAPARCVVACQEAQRALTGPWRSAVEEDRYRSVKATIDSFIDGDVIAVRVPPSKSAKAQLALLEPPNAAVWEFRTRPERKKGAHRYGVRIFGMFVKRDIFIAMSGVFKEDLLDKSEYVEEIAFCVQRWRSLFASYNPNQGTSADVYLSNWIPS